MPAKRTRPLDATDARTYSCRILELKKTDSARQTDWTNTNRFAELARAADRVQSSRWDRRMRLIIFNRFL
eukprot:3106351-Pyramimonas_sp.AAC.1